MICLPIGVLTAWILVRFNFRGKMVLNTFVYIPLVLPPVVLGYILLLIFGRRGGFGEWIWEAFGVAFVFNWKGAAIAAFVMAFPLMVRAVKLSLEEIDLSLEDAARTLGAPNWWVFISITLPLMLPGIITGSMLTFARSLGEFGATITFVSNIPGETRTLPIALYTAIQSPDGEPQAIRLVIICLIISFSAIIISELLSRYTQKKLGK